MDFQYKMVVAVRTDVKLSGGKMAVQVAHAAVSCAHKASKNDKRNFRPWFSEGQKKVVVKVADLATLRELEFQARQAALTTSMISDAGMTEVAPGTVTCLGIGPASNPRVDSITGKLSLF